MLYDVNTPSEYLTELDEDWRKEKLMELRSILLGYKFTEGIRYKMLSYADDRGVVFSTQRTEKLRGAVCWRCEQSRSGW